MPYECVCVGIYKFFVSTWFYFHIIISNEMSIYFSVLKNKGW